MSNQRKITAILLAKPSKTGELQALLSAMTAQSRAEPGNLRWDVWQDQDEPTRFVLDELYRDDAAVLAHRASSHFQHYAATIGDLADRTALVSTPFNVTESHDEDSREN